MKILATGKSYPFGLDSQQGVHVRPLTRMPVTFQSMEAIDAENRYANAASIDSLGKERNPKRMLNTCSKRDSVQSIRHKKGKQKTPPPHPHKRKIFIIFLSQTHLQ